MSRPDGLLYTSSHEWVRVNGDVATVGITDHAVEALGDLAYVDLPETGIQLEKGNAFGEIESTKAASELFAPLSGEVIEVNDELEENLQRITDTPFEAGWLIKIRLSNPQDAESLLDDAGYDEILHQQEH